MYGLKTDWIEDPTPRYYSLEDYEGKVARWCTGCGDHAVLTAVQRVCKDEQLEPDKTVFVSGIGCSSRFPHYMKTYGFHGLHGRALPVACGIRSRRPDLNIFVATGDGDCCSIGTAHWIHAVHYNMNMVVMLFDNNCYGLTKNQTSPTSPKGAKSNTHPRGAAMHPPHLFATLQAAHRHQGLSFVQIVQRCPHYKLGFHDPLQSDPSKLLLMTYENGIQLDDSILKIFKNQQEHDPSDMDTARELAGSEDPIAIGLFYQDKSVDRYDEYTAQGLATPRDEKIAALKAELSRYQI